MQVTESKSLLHLFVGCYADAASPGISVYTFDTDTGSLTLSDRYTGVENPSFLAVDPARRKLYAVSETMEFEGQAGGAIGVWSIDPDNGKLNRLQLRPTFGGAPCHIEMTPNREAIIVTNYMGGNVAYYSIDKDGLLEEPVLYDHSGSGPNPNRQEGPHPHSALIDPAGQSALVADLGIDRIVRYELDAANAGLIRKDELAANPGAGPRHMAFHPNGSRLYVINELDSTVTVYSYGEGQIHALQTISTLPNEFEGASTCADIHIDPAGSFLYGSNRGHDSIAVFQIDEDGMLKLTDVVPTGGRTPRNFTLTPEGHYLLVGNQDSNSIHIFRRDVHTGKLEPIGSADEPSRPVCLRFAALRP